MSDLIREGGPFGGKRTGPDTYEMSVPVPSQSGRVARECPSENCSPGYFKVVMGTGITQGQTLAYCPYCRHESPPDDFLTDEQKRYAIDALTQHVAEGFTNSLANALNLDSSGRRRIGGGLFSIEMHLERSPPPSLRLPYEEQVRRDVVCPHCGLDQSVYGLATWCADCGADIFLTHLHAEFNVVKSMLGDITRREQMLGVRVAAKDLENALEDVVSIFEAALRALIRRRLLDGGRTADEVREIFNKQIRNGFQNVTRSEELLQTLCEFEIRKVLTDAELSDLSHVFAKRHLIAHNLGVIDRKYLDTAKSAANEGAELPVSAPEIERAMAVVLTFFHAFCAARTVSVPPAPKP